MNKEILEKQYQLITEPLKKEEKNLIFKILLQNKNLKIEDILYLGEILEEMEEMSCS